MSNQNAGPLFFNPYAPQAGNHYPIHGYGGNSEAILFANEPVPQPFVPPPIQNIEMAITPNPYSKQDQQQNAKPSMGILR